MMCTPVRQSKPPVRPRPALRIVQDGLPRFRYWVEVVVDTEAMGLSRRDERAAERQLLGKRQRSVATPPAPRSGRGRFSAGTLPVQGMQPFRGTLCRPRQEAYYVCTNGGELQRSMLPQMRHAVECQQSTSTSLWDPHADDVKASLTSMLDGIAGVMFDEATSGMAHLPSSSAAPLHGSHAFVRPLMYRAQTTTRTVTLTFACMLVERAKVALCKHMSMSKRGYLKLSIAHVPKSTPKLDNTLMEYAHRVVVWAMYGPPPADIVHPVVMHTCNNPACLNPNHLVWGESSENSNSRTADAAALMREEQQRVGDL